MLSTNYTIKMILSVVVMLVIAINFVTISNAIELCKQKGFFYMHDNCSYYNMVFNNDLELNEGVDEEMPRDEYLYYRMYEKFQDRSYQYADMSDYYSMRYPFVMVNRNAFDEICRKNPQIDAIKNKVLQRNVSLLYPQKIKKGSVDYNNALDIRDYGFLNKREYGEWNILFYQNDVRVEGIHFDGSSPYYNKKIYKDPIILVNNSVYKSDSETGYDVFYNYDIMYDITNKQWNQFLQEENTDGLEVRLTNVKDEYEYTWQQRRRQMELTIVLIILIMILNVTMLSIVIRMEYRSNAVELALKKVYGYSLYNRNERIIKKSIISGVIGLFFALICNTFLKFEISILTLIGTCTITICVEIVLILLIALSFEKRNIVMVLKGERI